MATTCDLVAIRTALLAPFAAAATTLGAAVVTYQAIPQGKPWDAASPAVRAVVSVPSRQVLGAAVDRIVQQDGTLTLQWLFPRGTGMDDVALAVEGTAAIYYQQTLNGGVIVTGDARTVRIGREGDRIRWDVVVPWRAMNVETASGDVTPLRGSLPTTSEALASVRNLWLSQVEQTGSGWDGLTTFYDDEPTFVVPPAMPWAGYWLSELVAGSNEVQTPTERVLGRSLVQLHTDPSLGEAVPLAIVERIVAEHCRTVRGVTFSPVQVASKAMSRAGTYQTNLRIPFAFERLRPS